MINKETSPFILTSKINYPVGVFFTKKKYSPFSFLSADLILGTKRRGVEHRKYHPYSHKQVCLALRWNAIVLVLWNIYFNS